MKRPLGLVVVGAVGAFLIASVGASAHAGALNFVNFSGAHQTLNSDQTTGTPTQSKESPEPSEKPEASPTPRVSTTAKPTAKPTETPEINDEDSDDMPSTSTSTGDSEEGSGGGD